LKGVAGGFSFVVGQKIILNSFKATDLLFFNQNHTDSLKKVECYEFVS